MDLVPSVAVSDKVACAVTRFDHPPLPRQSAWHPKMPDSVRSAIPESIKVFMSLYVKDYSYSPTKMEGLVTRPFEACRLYAMVAGEQPQNRSVHRKLVDACVQQGPDLLAWYLWEFAEAGQVAQVLDSALGVMRHPVWSRAQREELMGLVTHGLSRKNETVDEFAVSSAARSLRELSEDPVVGEGAKGLLHLYEPGALDAARIRWWTSWPRATTRRDRRIKPFGCASIRLRSTCNSTRPTRRRVSWRP